MQLQETNNPLSGRETKVLKPVRQRPMAGCLLPVSQFGGRSNLRSTERAVAVGIIRRDRSDRDYYPLVRAYFPDGRWS